MKVLMGARKFLSINNPKIIQLEFNWHHLMTKNSIFEFSQILKNYIVTQLNLVNGTLQEIDPKDPLSNIFHLSNFIFIEKNYFKKYKKDLR